MAPPGAYTPGQTSGKQTMTTSGTKPAGCADSVCGAWTYPRDYYVTLPKGYVNNKAYPIVFEGPGCGGQGTDVYGLNDPTAGNTGNVNNTVIRVGLTPPPNAIGHATNPNQGCFDDKEGDSSVDWVFYENLYDKLASTICFDKNRVFASGNSSGAWFSNELGCKYAGDPTRPVRGIMPNTGGLPTTPAPQVTTCSSKPMAGMWVGENMDPEKSIHQQHQCDQSCHHGQRLQGRRLGHHPNCQLPDRRWQAGQHLSADHRLPVAVSARGLPDPRQPTPGPRRHDGARIHHVPQMVLDAAADHAVS